MWYSHSCFFVLHTFITTVFSMFIFSPLFSPIVFKQTRLFSKLCVDCPQNYPLSACIIVLRSGFLP